MKVSDLMRGLLLESGNDAAVTLAEGVSGSRKAFVREMNRRARSLGLKHTHFANPIGLDQEGNYSSARDLVTLATVLRTNSFFKKVVDSPVGHAEDRRPPAHVQEPQPARAQLRVRQRRQDRPHARRGLRARGQRQPQRRPAHQRRARHAERGRPRPRHDGALQLGDPALPAHPRGDQGPRDGDGADPLPRRRRAQAGPDADGPPDRRCAGTATRSRSTSTRRRSSRGRSAAASGSGASRSARAARSSPPSPLIAQGSVPATSVAQRTKSAAGTPVDPARRRAGGTCRYGPARTPTRSDEPPAPPAEAQRRMIVTVTLNTAIDKTLSVPNFRLGRRHRTVEQTTMPGGKGVNVARVLKTLGAPVIATGLGGRGDRHAHRRPAHAALACSSDFVRIGEESRTNTAVIDPTTGEQTEINERGPEGHAARGRAVRGQAAVPGQGRDRVRVRRLAAARRRHRHLRAPDPRAAAPERHDRGRHRRRPAAARRARGAGHHLAERARGRGARRPRVQRRRGPHLRRARDVRARRARGDHDDDRRRVRADAARTRARPSPTSTASGCAAGRSSRARPSAPATPSWPASSPPATRARPMEESLGLRRRLRRRVDRSTWAPAWWTRNGSSGCSARSRWSAPRSPPPGGHNNVLT